MSKVFIRPIAICLFRNGNRILVSTDFDSVKQSYFCRPIGGGIEFGESSAEAMLREIKEEINLAVENLRLVGVLENIFDCEGQDGHEIVFVYDAEFADKSVYEADEIAGYEQDLSHPFKATWLDLERLDEGSVRLVPEKLVELIMSPRAGAVL